MLYLYIVNNIYFSSDMVSYNGTNVFIIFAKSNKNRFFFERIDVTNIKLPFRQHIKLYKYFKSLLL